MVKKNVLIISTSETFTVKGLGSKLNELEIDSHYVTTKIKTIELFINKADFFVFYLDDAAAANPDVLVFLNDTCTEKEKKIILIGTRLEFEAVSKYIDAKNLIEWFERPLNMEKFLDCVQLTIESANVEEMKKSVLIVDDDVAYMQMIRKWIKTKYRVAMANSGIQAITWLAKNKADLILMDYDMPVATGPKVLEMLKTEAETSSIPVMFLTGRGDRVSIQRVLSLHPADYLLKSIDQETLLGKLDGFFANHNANHSDPKTGTN